MKNLRNTHTYDTIFEISDGKSSELHFSLRDDGVYILSRCQILRGGEKVYMRSSIIMSKDVAIKIADSITNYIARDKSALLDPDEYSVDAFEV